MNATAYIIIVIIIISTWDDYNDYYNANKTKTYKCDSPPKMIDGCIGKGKVIKRLCCLCLVYPTPPFWLDTVSDIYTHRCIKSVGLYFIFTLVFCPLTSRRALYSFGPQAKLIASYLLTKLGEISTVYTENYYQFLTHSLNNNCFWIFWTRLYFANLRIVF